MEKRMISIDRWSEESQSYFLTHLHADHTKGLSSKWSKGPLFCSPISSALLPSKFPGIDLTLIRVLDVGSTTELSFMSPTSGDDVAIAVTVIDAHHCPGAVMYLFRGEFGSVLYTGDFRWESTSERAQLGKKTLLEALGGDNVDVLYLDNTYCNPSYSFPSREVATQQIIDIIAGHPDRDVIIGIDTLGKEALLLKIAEALNIKIWVWPERLRTMHLLGYFDMFTTKTSLTRVRAVPRYNVTFDTLQTLNTIHPTIGIMPSGLPWAACPKTTGCNESGGNAVHHQYFHSIPYSEHACFSEIQEFVKTVLPATITGIVSSSTCYINPRHYFRHLCGASHLSYQPNWNIKAETIEESDAKQSDSNIIYRSSKKPKGRGKVKMKSASLRVRRSRICILRRKMRGAKVAEDVCDLASA